MLLHYHHNYPNIDSPAYHHNKQLNKMKIYTQNSFLKMLAKPFGTLFLMCLLALNANAQTFSGTGNWSTGANWSGGIPPNTLAANAIIATGAICTIDIPNAVCGTLTVQGTGQLLAIPTGAGLIAGGAIAGNSVAVLTVNGRIDFTGSNILFKIRTGRLNLNDGVCFVPGTSTLILGIGASTTANNSIVFSSGGAKVVNLYNLELDYGNFSFLHGNNLGLAIANNLILTSGTLGTSGAVTGTLTIGQDLIVPAPGGTLVRPLKQTEPRFDPVPATDCTNTTIPEVALNFSSTIQVRDVKIASGATLTLGNSTYLRVSRNWGEPLSTGALAVAGTEPTIEFNGTADAQTFGALNGNHVNFSTAFVVINKQPLLGVDSKFTATAGMRCAGRFAIKKGDFIVPSGPSVEFNNICISGGDFVNQSDVDVRGNWTLTETGTFFDGIPVSAGGAGAGTRIKFIGTTTSTIKIIPDGTTSPVAQHQAVNQNFRDLVISKTGVNGIVTNATGAGSGTVIRVAEALLISSGLLFINEVTTAPKSFVPLLNQVSGYTITHADGTLTDVPPADLDVRGQVIISGGGGLNLTGALTPTTNVPEPGLTLWVGDEFKDNNPTEPTERLGFYVGRPSPLGRFATRPVMVFNGVVNQVVQGSYSLRDGLDQNVGTPNGIVLPNVIMGRQGATSASPVFDVVINGTPFTGSGTGGAMRILGDLVIAVGSRLNTGGYDLYFGDQSNGNALLDNTDILDVFGRLLVTAGSNFYMATGEQATGTFLRIRQGGQVSFAGTPAARVNVIRDIRAGSYYRMCAYSGSKVNAAYTDFGFQGQTNDGFFPTLPAAQSTVEFNYGTTAATQNALNNGTPGVNRNFLGDFVNSDTGPVAGSQSKGGFKILQGASIGTADVLVPNTIDPPVPSGAGSVDRNFSSCSFQAGASCFTALTINTGQALDIAEVVFVGSSGGNNAGCDYNIVNFFDNYADVQFNTDGVNDLNIIYCYGCLGARAGSLGETYDGGYDSGAPSPAVTPATTGRGSGEERVVFFGKQLIWWTGDAGSNSWNDKANWTVDRLTANISADTRPDVAPGTDGLTKKEVKRLAYIAFINAKIGAGEVFNADGITPYSGGTYMEGNDIIGAFIKPVVLSIPGSPTVFLIRYKPTGETNRDYEVFIPKGGANATPLVDTNNPTVGFPDVWITGGLLINSPNNPTIAVSPGLQANRAGAGAGADKTVNIDDKILRVENDAVGVPGGNISYTIAPAIPTVGLAGVLELGGNLSFNGGGQYRNSNNFSLLRLINNGIQQVRIDGARDISHLIVNKVNFDASNAVILGSAGGGANFQGNSRAMTVKFDATIITGDVTMYSDTPFIVERNFTMETGGSLDLIGSYAVFGGSFTNRGVVRGGRRIFFTPINTTLGATTRTITTNGQVLPPVTFFNGTIDWNTLPTSFGLGNNNISNAYATGAGVNNSVAGLVEYNLQDNLITSGAGGGALVEGTVIQNNRRVNTANNTVLRFFAPVGVAAGTNILKLETGSTLNLTQGVRLEIDALGTNLRTLLVQDGALLQALGIATSSSFITRFGGAANPAGRFAFTIAGSIRASFYTFEFMDADGVNMATNANSRALDIDVTKRCFSNCTFTNGTNGGTLLKVHNTAFPNYLPLDMNQPLILYPATAIYIENVSFPSPLATGSNVAWVNVQPKGGFFIAPPTPNKLIFNLSVGGFSGEDFDDDNNNAITDLADNTNCIRWVEPNIVSWTGASNGGTAGTLAITGATEAVRSLNTDWNDAENWSPMAVPASTDNVVLDRTHFSTTDVDYKAIITSNVTVRSIKIAQAGAPNLNNIDNKRIILQISDGASTPTVQILQSLTIGRNKAVGVASVSINDAIVMISNPLAILNVGTSWSNEGRFLNGNINDADGIPVATANAIPGVGELKSSKLLPSVANFLAGGSTVNFNEDQQRVLYNGSLLNTDNIFTKFNALNNVVFVGPDTDLNSNLYLQGNLTVNNSLAFKGGLGAGGGNMVIDIKGDWLNNGIFTPNSGTVRFTGTGNQRMERNFFYPFGVQGPAGIISNTVKEPENFNDVVISKPTGDLILDSRMFIAGAGGIGKITFGQGKIIASTNKEVIIGLNADAGTASVDTDSYIIGPMARVFDITSSVVLRDYSIGDVDGWFASVRFGAQLNATIPTAFSITQIPGLPVVVANGRDLPLPFNAIAQRCYWNVKNINFPITANRTAVLADTSVAFRAEFQQGGIKLKFDPLEQDLPPPLVGTILAYNQGGLDGATATVEASIIQTPSVDVGSAPGNPTLNDRRGFGPVVPAVGRSAWLDLGGVADFNGLAQEFTSTDFFHLGNGDFALAYRFIPLPVELIDFSGKYIDDKVRLNWVVTSEKDVVSYTVSRSSTGRADSFTEIGTVAATVSPNTINTYGLDDLSSFSGINYYRLAQTDRDGTKRNISKIIAVTNKKSFGESILLYPNPSENGQFSINIPERSEVATISIYSLTGTKVFEQENKSSTNGKIENIDASKQLSKGLYVVRVKVADKVYQTKLSIN